MARLKGIAAPYNEWANIGGSFMERFAPGALREAVGTDVAAFHHHDSGQVLGRTINGSLTLNDAPDGLRFTLDLPSTQLGEDTAALVRRGDVTGVSVGFRVPRASDEEWWIDDNDVVRREITRAELLEVSITVWPAYAGATVQARAAVDGQARQIRSRMLRRQMQARLQARLRAVS